MPSLLPAPASVLDACRLVEDAVGSIMRSLGELPGTAYRYEADTEARHLLFTIVRHTEAVVTLAREDLILIAPAMVLGRAALEGWSLATWLLDPEDPLDREARWLAHLGDEVAGLRKRATELEQLGHDATRERTRAETITEFREGVAAQLPVGYEPPTRKPNVRDRMATLGKPGLYSLYRSTSEFVHGSRGGTAIYRRNLGSDLQQGEFTRPDQWAIPLALCWLSIDETSRAVAARGNGALSLADEVRARIESAIALVSREQDPARGE